MAKNKIRVRYAPSPTGHLHIGNARTALFNYLFARHNKGTLVLRIEDTDTARNVEGGAESQIENLHWLGTKVQTLAVTTVLTSNQKESRSIRSTSTNCLKKARLTTHLRRKKNWKLSVKNKEQWGSRHTMSTNTRA